MKARAPSRVAAALAAVLLLSHCAQPGKNGLPLSEQELRAAAQAHQAVLKASPPLEHPALQAYVGSVGQRLAQASRHDLAWQFIVVDSAEVDAFSLPGGQVYLSRGLLAYLDSEAELAAVIGHEIGHVIARHRAAPAGAPDAGPGPILAPKTDDPQDASFPARAQAGRDGYGRAPELEASRLGAAYLAAAGYAPRAMIGAIEALRNHAQFAATRGARAYHAAALAGDARLEADVEKAGRAAVAEPRTGRDDYLQQLAGLGFGERPDRGRIRDNLLLHAGFGLAVQFPPGWQVQRRAGRVAAASPAGDALLELQPAPKRGPLLETLRQGIKLDPGARYDSGRLDGHPAAFVAGAQSGRPVVAAAVAFKDAHYLIAGRADDAAAYARERTALRSAINSFRALTAAEKQAARPQLLQLVRAAPGTTMAGLARQSPLGADAEAELRLINHLYPSGEPEPGQFLKIVQ